MSPKKSTEEIPPGIIRDNSYVTDEEPIPVVPDDAPIEDPTEEGTAKDDDQLDLDEVEVIDDDGPIEEHTRHARPVGGTYREPDDEDDLPVDTGRSAVNKLTDQVLREAGVV